MKRQNIAIVAIAAVTLILGGLILTLDAAPAQEGGDGHDHGAHAEGGGMPSHVKITPEAAIAAGAKLATAGPGKVAQSVRTSGTVVFDSAGIARARARFPGVVREVRKNVGDKVAAGEVIAMVESNDSLQAYAVKAPIEGVIIARNTNLGEITDDSPLFVIANPSRVWSELHIFSKDLNVIAVGQNVTLQASDKSVEGKGSVTAILPVTETSTQTVIARVSLVDTDGRWRPGMIVSGDIVWAEREVPVAIPAAAIQTMNDKPVVFVQDGKQFEVRPVLLGAMNGEWAEVIEGLYEDEIYVAANSFLMKADAGKESAEHEH
jgi:membrane fusion protein, heavy metal efflux system